MSDNILLFSIMIKTFDAIFFTDITDTVLVSRPLGAFKVSHVMRTHGFDALTVDHMHMWSLDEIKNLLHLTVSDKTKIIGISTTFLLDTQDNDVKNHNVAQKYKTQNIRETFCPQGKDFENEMISTIKKINPQCKILVGGHQASAEIYNRNVDFVMTGYAEQSIIDLMNHLKSNEDLPNAYKNLWGITIIPGIDIPGPVFAQGGMKWNREDIFNAKVLPIETARGCIFNCKFCAYPLRGKKTLDFVLDHDLLYREVRENHERYGITTYSLMDDTFNDNDLKLDRILSVTKKLNFQPIFWCYSRLDLIASKPERFKKMYDIGVRGIYFGIETLNERTGRLVGKGLSASKQIKTIQDIRNNHGDNVMLHGSLILGLPGEILESMKKTFDVLHSQEMPLHTWHWKALNIRKYTRYKSDIEKNYQSHGFKEIGEENGYIDWVSETTSYQDMKLMENEWNKLARQTPDFRIPNQTAWFLMNYPKYNFDKVSKMKWKDIDWNDIGYSKIQFVEEYKKQMFQWLVDDQ